jgi:hypothetical protein
MGVLLLIIPYLYIKFPNRFDKKSEIGFWNNKILLDYMKLMKWSIDWSGFIFIKLNYFYNIYLIVLIVVL